MTDIKRYTTAFAQALAEHLRGRVPERLCDFGGW
jgi:hypothetical protein